jgi:hypothetical protein
MRVGLGPERDKDYYGAVKPKPAKVAQNLEVDFVTN